MARAIRRWPGSVYGPEHIRNVVFWFDIDKVNNAFLDKVTGVL